MPAGKIVRVGVWEDGLFIGCVLFSSGANNNIAKPFYLTQHEVCELTRVALTKHKSEVTKIVSIAIRMLRKKETALKLIVSYADPEQGHDGIIYKAGNWEYLGQTSPINMTILNGKKIHNKTIHETFGTRAGLPAITVRGKHKFCYWLDKSAREVFMQKRLLSSKRGGKIPTHALH